MKGRKSGTFFGIYSVWKFLYFNEWHINNDPNKNKLLNKTKNQEQIF